MTITYRTNKNSLAHRVLVFLVSNPDETLLIEDIVIKFDVPTNSIKSLLAKAVKVGALRCEKKVFSLGNMATAQQAIEDGKPIITRTPATPAAPAPQASSPRQSIDDATGEEWNAAAAAVCQKQQIKAPAVRGINSTSLTVPGIGELTITYEPMASKLPVSGYKWDLVLDHLASVAPCIDPEGFATIRLPKSMTGAAKAGIESWHKRHAALTFPCRFRAAVAGDQVLIQRIA